MNKINVFVLGIIATVIVLSSSFSFSENTAGSETEKIAKNTAISFSNGKTSIQADNIQLTDLFSQISEQTGTVFKYDKASVFDKKITIQLTDVTLQEAVRQILKKAEIKNYSTKRGPDDAHPLALVEILSPPPSSAVSSTPLPAEQPLPPLRETIVEEPEEPIASEEEPIEDQSGEYKPPQTKKPAEKKPAKTDKDKTEVKEKTKTETAKKEESSRSVGSRVYSGGSSSASNTLKDSSSEYYPPGSKSSSANATPKYQPGDTIPDMSNEYHPPGYVPGTNTNSTKYNPGDTIQDASDEYHPPGYVKGSDTNTIKYDPSEPVPDMSNEYHPPGYK